MNEPLSTSSSYHSYIWPFSWTKSMDDPKYYPGLDPLVDSYDDENKLFAFGRNRDEIHMNAGSKIMFRDVISSDRDMLDLYATQSSLRGLTSDSFEYASDTLYHSYLDASPGSYFWDFAGVNFQWVYPSLHHGCGRRGQAAGGAGDGGRGEVRGDGRLS